MIALQQVRRNVIFVSDATASENAIEETRKQSASIFLQNLDRISKMGILDDTVDIEFKDMEGPDSTFNSFLKTSKGEEFIKTNQRRSTVADRKSSIFISSVPATGTITHDIKRKWLRIDENETSVEHLSAGSTSSKREGSENIGVQSMQMDVPPIDSFTPLEAAAISCVLQEFLEQLATFGFVIPADVDPRWDDTFKTIDETYGVPDEPRTIFREDMDLLPLIPTASEKMQRDRNYLQKVLKRIFRDVRYSRRFDTLQEEINNIAKKQEDEHNLEVNAQIWRSQAEQLRELLESDKKANEEDRKETTNLAQESDAQVDHAIFLNSAKLSYAERWAKARLEQQDLKLKLQKTDILNKLSNYTKKYSAEEIVSAEITAYLEADIKDKEEQVIEWTKRYNEEIVLRQQEIDKLKDTSEIYFYPR
ncbi:uncharacterized protein LOC116840381 [Odontomachus brunneus]|uniref:uncharacterized protein LOC116840381 n=1 Tax=Odontomachus brunneus TaxID=486640 RepID=UPI0013F18BE9|nr:uncharacterized protein LOC116840381 [Odontomachus brunneus]